jgi:hypothetical protein
LARLKTETKKLYLNAHYSQKLITENQFAQKPLNPTLIGVCEIVQAELGDANSETDWQKDCALAVASASVVGL